MLGYKQKSELCKKIANLYQEIGETETICITKSCSMKRMINSPEYLYYVKASFDYEKLSKSPRLLFVRKSTLEETLKNLENRLKEINI